MHVSLLDNSNAFEANILIMFILKVPFHASYQCCLLFVSPNGFYLGKRLLENKLWMTLTDQSR